ncbi:hypothetical protein PM082_013812 [Marasmius tenuissimus]|nr:hypothetical protein PM082_013812 [Marasmius tenuissimus]
MDIALQSSYRHPRIAITRSSVVAHNSTFSPAPVISLHATLTVLSLFDDGAYGDQVGEVYTRGHQPANHAWNHVDLTQQTWEISSMICFGRLKVHALFSLALGRIHGYQSAA